MNEIIFFYSRNLYRLYGSQTCKKMSEKSNYYRVERELTHQEVIELYLKTKQELDEEKRNTKIWENAFEEECLEHDKELEDREKELEELKAWKEEAIEVMNKLQLQEIGKELQLPLGSDIPSQILPEIKRIKAITDEAISILAAKDMLYKSALDEIIKLKTK